MIVNRRLASKLLCGLALALSLTALAAAPAGRYTVTTDTVLDTKTTLTWQRAIPAQPFTWASAATYCQGLTLSGTGWRLPTVKELQSLIDIRASSPTIDATAFPNTMATYFWSSSLQAGSTGQAWAVSFTPTASSGGVGVTNSMMVRCVR